MKDFKFLMIQANSPMDTLISPGLARLMGCVKQAGFQTKLFDTTFYNTRGFTGDDQRVETLQVRETNFSDFGISFNKTDMIQDFLKVVEEYKPNLIGLSAVTCTYQHGLKLLNSVNGIPTIVGGVHPTVCPEIIEEPAIDYVCVGEGEQALIELCNALYHKRDASHIPNLWTKEVKNPMRPPVNLDSLPFQDLDSFEERRLYKPMGGKIRRTMAISTGRFCQRRCFYCTNSYFLKMYPKGYREFSISRVLREMEYYIKKYRIEYFYMATESFLETSKKRFKEFAEGYMKFRTPFWIQTRPESITEEKMQLLKQMGCECINIGIESGDTKLRREILNRKMTDEQIIEGVRIAKKYKIRIGANNIIGIPTETREQIFKTIELNRKANPDNSQVHIFLPYNGTKLYDLCIEKGYIPKNFDVSKHGGDYRSDFVLNMPQISNDELRGLRRTFNMYIKFPRSRWPEIKKAEKDDKIFKKLSKIYRRDFLAGSN